jgi:hypothetical protein
VKVEVDCDVAREEQRKSRALRNWKDICEKLARLVAVGGLQAVLVYMKFPNLGLWKPRDAGMARLMFRRLDVLVGKVPKLAVQFGEGRDRRATLRPVSGGERGEGGLEWMTGYPLTIPGWQNVRKKRRSEGARNESGMMEETIVDWGTLVPLY